jgi:hypothetical protein
VKRLGWDHYNYIQLLGFLKNGFYFESIVYRSTIGLELKLNYKVPSTAYPLSYSPYSTWLRKKKGRPWSGAFSRPASAASTEWFEGEAKRKWRLDCLVPRMFSERASFGQMKWERFWKWCRET